MQDPAPYLCAAWLMVAFVSAGALQASWLYSRFAARFSSPIDRGRTFRGKRILGENKTWRGFLVMVPAVGVSFLLLGVVRERLPPSLQAGLWPVPVWQYGLIGCWAGLGFMLAELPNSFLKRQLGIPPGKAPREPRAGFVCFLLDQVDSVVGALLATSVFVPVPMETWILLLVMGPFIHWLFNVVLFLLGAKTRAA